MRHCFILNPAAGKKGRALGLEPEIHRYFEAHPGADYAIRVTTAPDDARLFAREEAEHGEPVRVYACGGDGTLLEAAEGLDGFPHAELASVPCGSGNDYVKTFGELADFLDLPRLIEGSARTVDAILVDGTTVALNLCSLGLDADVASKMSDYKNLPLVSGPMAYDLALVYVLAHPIGQRLRLRLTTTEGIVEREGRYLFALAANGQYYGGGYHGAPKAVPDDGLLDFVLIQAVSKAKAVSLVGKYKRGEHLGWEICEFLRGSRMEVSVEQPTAVNVDGECEKRTSATFEVLPQRFRFVIPRT